MADESISDMPESAENSAPVDPATPVDAAGLAAGAEHRAEDPYPNLPPALKVNVWQKGHSGNPSGRPKREISLVDGLRKYAGKKAVDVPWARKLLAGLGLTEADAPCVGDVVMAAMALQGAKGNAKILTEMLDRFDGKVEQPVRLTGKVGVGPFDEMSDADLERIISHEKQQARSEAAPQEVAGPKAEQEPTA